MPNRLDIGPTVLIKHSEPAKCVAAEKRVHLAAFH